MLKYIEELGMYIRPENINLMYPEGNNGAPTKGKNPTIKHYEVTIEFIGGEALVAPTKYKTEDECVEGMHQLASLINAVDTPAAESINTITETQSATSPNTAEPQKTEPEEAQVITIGEERSRFINYLEKMGFKITLARVNGSEDYTFIVTHSDKIIGLNDRNFVAFNDPDPVQAVKAAIIWFSAQQDLINETTQDNYAGFKGYQTLITAAQAA